MRKILFIVLMLWGSEQALAANTANIVTEMISWLLSSLFVVALILVLAFMVKKTRLKFGQDGHIQLLSALSVGPKEKVVMIEVQKRRLLLGVTPVNVRLLCELNSGDDFKDTLQHAELKTSNKALDQALDQPLDQGLKTESENESLRS